MAIRLDFGTVRSMERTPSGGLRVPSFLTRTGIFVYTRTDGTVTRELRLPEEVFSPESMASLRGAPVTELHPPTLVDPDSWKLYSRGNVGDEIRQEEGSFLGADLLVQDAATIAKVESRELVEISCGYDAQVDPTPGTYNGEPYDAIQRRIRYNHAALGPAGWGRAGSDVSLRMDAADAIQDPGAPPAPNPKQDPAPKTTGRKDNAMFRLPKVQFSKGFDTVRIDGVAYSLKGDGAAQASQALEAAMDRALLSKPRKDGDDNAIAQALEEALGILTGAQQQLMQAAIAAANPEPPAADPNAEPPPADDDAPITDEEEAEKKVDPEVLDSLVSKRVALLDRAKALAPKSKFDGLKPREVMETAIKAAAPKVKLDSKTSIDFVRGVFESLPVAGSGRSHLDSARVALNPHADGGAGEGDERVDAEAARIAARKASREAFRKPLAGTLAK